MVEVEPKGILFSEYLLWNRCFAIIVSLNPHTSPERKSRTHHFIDEVTDRKHSWVNYSGGK